jgi:hypothetical protein
MKVSRGLSFRHSIKYRVLAKPAVVGLSGRGKGSVTLRGCLFFSETNGVKDAPAAIFVKVLFVQS